jgi:hypothetical protein
MTWLVPAAGPERDKLVATIGRFAARTALMDQGAAFGAPGRTAGDASAVLTRPPFPGPTDHRETTRQQPTPGG